MSKQLEALKVIALDPKTVTYLEENDPPGLEQVQAAIASDEEVRAGKNFIRKFSLLLLDDEQGVKKQAYELLSVMLVDSGNEDLLQAVDITEDRAYIGEDYAEEELSKLQ